MELELILERIDAIRTIARDLKHIPKLTGEDTKGLDELEETLKDSLKKVVIRAECSSPGRKMNMTLCSYGVSDYGGFFTFAVRAAGSLVLLCATHRAMCKPPSNPGSASAANICSTAPNQKH